MSSARFDELELRIAALEIELLRLEDEINCKEEIYTVDYIHRQVETLEEQLTDLEENVYNENY